MGDFNSDHVEDFAVSLIKPSPEPSSGKLPMIAVFFGNGKGEFALQTQAPKATCVDCGGMKGPGPDVPLGTLEVLKNGILAIKSEGGSREVWSDITKWRWDKNSKQFLLIGETYTSFDSIVGSNEILDVNFSTLRAENTRGKRRKLCKVPQNYKGQTLANYDSERFDISSLFNSCH